jgi:twinkle protein
MKTVKCKVLKVKFQNLGENGAEAHFKWEPRSGCFIPQQPPDLSDSKMPWE